MLLYVCENDDCPKCGEKRSVPKGTMADCPACGWSMVGEED